MKLCVRLPIQTFKAAKTFLCLFYFFNCSVWPQVTSSLQLCGAIKQEKEISKSFTLATTLLQPFSSFCIISGNQHILDAFIDYYQNQNQTFTLLEPGITMEYNCESVVMLDASPQLCGKITYKKFKGAFYSLHLHSTFNLTKLRYCFENSSSPEVVVVSLRDTSLFELSPVFPFPRFFAKSSVRDIINHRNHTNVDNFRGVHIKAALMKYEPFVIVQDTGQKPIDEIDGIEIVIFKELSQKLNFTIHPTVYSAWGETSPNGSWLDGVGYAMQEGLAQVAICGLWQISAFDSLVNFGPSMATEKVVFLVRRPEQMDFDWKDVIKIFKVIVWSCVFSSFALTTVVYWLGLIRAVPSYIEDWSCSFLTVFGHFTLSTSYTYVTDQFTLTVLTSWSIFSLLLTTVLSTGIVSSLSVPMYSPRVDTLQQLAEGGYYWTAQFYIQFVSDELKQSMFNFQNNWHTVFEKKYKYLTADEVRTKMYSDSKIILSSQVLDNDFVVLDTEGSGGHACLSKFRVVREPVNKGHITFGVEKYSPMAEPLTKMAIRFMQAGLQRKWKFDVLNRWPQHDTRHLLIEMDVLTFSQPEMMPLSKLRPLFYMLLTGLMFAFVVFSIEILWYYA